MNYDAYPQNRGEEAVIGIDTLEKVVSPYSKLTFFGTIKYKMLEGNMELFLVKFCNQLIYTSWLTLFITFLNCVLDI